MFTATTGAVNTAATITYNQNNTPGLLCFIIAQNDAFD